MERSRIKNKHLERKKEKVIDGESKRENIIFNFWRKVKKQLCDKKDNGTVK